MTRIAVGLMCLAFACAAPSSTEYRRGTPAAPAPAPVRPGAGAPTYDPQYKPLPPQPQPRPERLLLPTPEPGIWAAKDPGAIGHGAPVLILNPDELLPDDPTSVEQYEVASCILVTQGLFAKAATGNMFEWDTLVERFLTWKISEQRCVTAKMYEGCFKILHEGYEAGRVKRAKQGQPPGPGVVRALRKAIDFRKRECDGVALSDDAELVLKRAGKEITARITAIERRGN